MGSLLSKWFSSREEGQLNLEETPDSGATNFPDNETPCPKTQLTNRQIVRLAASISVDNMAAIAEGYMNVSGETIKNFQYENRGQAQAFNREIIKFWVITNPAPNQAEV